MENNNPRPTIIGGSGPKPTTMPGAKPTVISASAPTAKVLPVLTVPVTHKPTFMGQPVKRIEVTREGLAKTHSLTNQKVIDSAFTLLQNVNPDKFTLNDVLVWGQNLQTEQNGLVNASLTLAQSEIITTVSANINRLLDILGNIQLAKVFEKTKGMFAGLLQMGTGAIDTPAELDEALREIGQLSTLMIGRMQDLLVLRERFDANSQQLNQLGDQIEGAVYAALTLADYFSTQKSSQSDLSIRFTERASSLTVTLGLIRSGGSMRNTHTEQPLRMIQLVQEVVLQTLPTWITNVTALRMAQSGSRKPNATEIDENSRLLTSLINKLK